MFRTSATQGVCAACKYDPACIYEADAGHVILQCEQFELALPAQDALPDSNGAGASPTTGEAFYEYAGLCANCENRETCIYPKPEGGVWRCEEYV